MGAHDHSARARIELEIELGSEPIKGAIKEGVSTPRSFNGWLELAEAIERVHDQHGRFAHDGTAPGGYDGE
jgi:hypothetical protein